MLNEVQMRRIEPYFPLLHGIPGVDDRRVLSGIIYVIKNGLCRSDAPSGHDPHKTLYSRVCALEEAGRIQSDFAALVKQTGELDILMIGRDHAYQKPMLSCSASRFIFAPPQRRTAFTVSQNQ